MVEILRLTRIQRDGAESAGLVTVAVAVAVAVVAAEQSREWNGNKCRRKRRMIATMATAAANPSQPQGVLIDGLYSSLHRC